MKKLPKIATPPKRIEIFFQGFGEGEIKPHEYGVWIHQDEYHKLQSEKDALLAELNHLKYGKKTAQDVIDTLFSTPFYLKSENAVQKKVYYIRGISDDGNALSICNISKQEKDRLYEKLCDKGTLTIKERGTLIDIEEGNYGEGMSWIDPEDLIVIEKTDGKRKRT